MPDVYSSYDRVRAALEHREADRIPFDLGGSVVTGMNRIAYANLRRFLGLSDKPIEICHTTQQLARIDDDVHEQLRTDVRSVEPDPPARAPLATEITRITEAGNSPDSQSPALKEERDSQNPAQKENRDSQSPAQKEKREYDTFVNEWGITWRMPVDGGFYFDMCGHPLAGAESVADIERFAWPDPLDSARFATLRQRADACVKGLCKPFVLGRCAAGTFELALWMRGFENFFMDLALNPVLAEALLDKINEIKMAYWARALEQVGETVLVVSEADDLATQRGLMISQDMYRRFIFPRHRQLFNHIRKHARGRVYIFYHSCGAVRPMIPTLIEEGIDILNPVQVSAEGMDTGRLKREFGRDLTFWGGGVDTQHVLPRGTPQQVRDEVRRRIDDLAPGGGFVFSTVHNVQADVPPENYMAMWETLQEYGAY